MARPLRIQFPGAVYHVMNRGLNRRSIFEDQDDFSDFLDLLGKIWKRWKVEVFAYCLMTNHYHLCLRTSEANLARVMRHVDGVFTQKFNNRHGKDGPLFRGRYKSILIEEDVYLHQVVQYIHLNPVKAGLVNHPEKYSYSSCLSYIFENKRPFWLNVEPVLRAVGGIHGFQNYSQGDICPELERIYQKPKLPVILGTEYFLKKIKNFKKKLNPEFIRQDRIVLRPQAKDVLMLISKEFELNKLEILNGKRGSKNELRKIAMWLVRHYCDLSHREIAEIFNLGSPKTVSWGCQQGEVLLTQKDIYRNQMRKIKLFFEKNQQPET